MQEATSKDKMITIDDKRINNNNKTFKNVEVNKIENKKKTLTMDDYYDSRDKTEFLLNLKPKDKEKLIAFSSYALKSLELTIKEESQQVRSLAPVKGEIWCFDFGFNVGSEMDKVRPCIIVSYEEFNSNSGLVTVIPITTSVSEIMYSTNFIINRESVDGNDVSVYGVAKAEGIVTKSKSRLGKKIGKLNNKGINSLNRALCAHLGLSIDSTEGDTKINNIDKPTNFLSDKNIIVNSITESIIDADKKIAHVKYIVKDKYSIFNNTKKSKITKKNKRTK